MPHSRPRSINMVHISLWEATVGLFMQSARLLQKDAPLILYGPYLRKDRETAPSNLAFDESLRGRDAEWGIRWLEDVTELAERQGFALEAIHEMPANNQLWCIVGFDANVGKACVVPSTVHAGVSADGDGADVGGVCVCDRIRLSFLQILQFETAAAVSAYQQALVGAGILATRYRPRRSFALVDDREFVSQPCSKDTPCISEANDRGCDIGCSVRCEDGANASFWENSG